MAFFHLSRSWVLTFLVSVVSGAAAQNAETIDKNFAVRPGESDGVVWHDPAEKPFQVSGFCFFE